MSSKLWTNTGQVNVKYLSNIQHIINSQASGGQISNICKRQESDDEIVVKCGQMAIKHKFLG